ncbi:hypothetical protein CEXT_696891 [Caerostris extrusa]|uniref:Uncharacterized protein n=1 Tax=Caerostris extrusa TaxID=172846 RepID=A0AAV4T0F7_CAEEX|nr:hypothetical protein CEXT_696891 [Caerostris extrusa]
MSDAFERKAISFPPHRGFVKLDKLLNEALLLHNFLLFAHCIFFPAPFFLSFGRISQPNICGNKFEAILIERRGLEFESGMQVAH